MESMHKTDIDKKSYQDLHFDLRKKKNLHQIGTDMGSRRLRIKLKMLNIEGQSPRKSKRKDKMVLAKSCSSELGKQSKTKMDTKIDEPLPMPERKDKMVLAKSCRSELGKQSKTKMDTKIDEPLPMPERKPWNLTGTVKFFESRTSQSSNQILTNQSLTDKMVLDKSCSPVGKQSKTKMDTKIDQPLPMPERKGYMIYLGALGDGQPFYKKRFLDDSQAWLSYHTNILEKVFGSDASEIIKPGYGFVDVLSVYLTEEELEKLKATNGAMIVPHATSPAVLF